MFCRSLLVLFHLAFVLSVLLRYTDSDYPFVIFKLFLLVEQTRVPDLPQVTYLWQVGYSGDVYTIQHYVIKFVSDLWQVGYSGLLHQ
jgi:hypothetical protein